jgi:hypothetical protein
MADYNIYVRDQRVQKSNTEVDITGGQQNTQMPPSTQGMSARSLASLAAVAGTAQTIGQTWLDIKTSRQGANEAARLNSAFKIGAYALAIAANPVIGTAYVVGDVVSGGLRQREERRKYDVNRNYTIDKLNISSASNTRYRGGRI